MVNIYSIASAKTVSSQLSTTMNINKYQLISISIFLFLLTFIFPQEADAGLIIQRPLYIGLTDGLVGYWSFDQQDMAGERDRKSVV